MKPSQQKSIIPQPVPQGGTLGVVAPSGPFDPALFKKGLAVLVRMGFQTVVPEGLSKKTGYLAGTDAHRAHILHEMFSDGSVEGIICARGGYGSVRILPLLDFDRIRKTPKPLIGFSDISALLNTLYLKCGLVTYHGPVVTTLAEATPKTRKSLNAALKGFQPLELVLSRPRVMRPGKAKGILMGGNLTTLCHLVGTPFAPRYKDAVLLLEDKGEPLYRIDRMLTQMKLSGCFKRIAGLILGEFVDCGDMRSLYRIFRDFFWEYEIPILGGFEIGHGRGNHTVPIGVPVELDTHRGSLLFQWP
ncbi:MAG: LD-carboxypeptidase [Deltaproteobacteria bacterium]|nr:LD-carboxypeptidase [Deltaproteobacteria bacterium]MBW2042533.1 LD-carboxypeptidase [Deltaproteobacteria bacterium]MBW2132624.1 LD-carboxypeptidase [Deltaproteobacteria bacterium]